MKKVKALICLLMVTITCIFLLTGCKKDPDKVSVTLSSYTKDGITYSEGINHYSFFDQFRTEDVTATFNEDKTFKLNVLGEKVSGTWEIQKESKVYDYSKKGTTFFKMTDERENTGEGYSASWGFDGFSDYLGFNYLGEKYEFTQRSSDKYINEDYSLETELMSEAIIIKGLLTPGERGKTISACNEDKYYKYSSEKYYHYVEIVKEGNRFIAKGNDSVQLNLSKGFFYDFDGTNIRYASSIREGFCVFKCKDRSISPNFDGYYAVFYL